jgi:c-di-GMP-binding flagellar brake protein YcgR
LRAPGDEHELPSRVEDADGTTVLVGAPFPRPRVEPGQDVAVEWGTSRGWYSLLTAYVGEEGETVPLWRLAPRGGARLLQRREYARAHVVLPVALVLGTGADARTASLLDISEGGARCVLTRPAGITIGDPATTILSTDRLQMTVPGSVIRVGTHDAWLDEVAVRFLQPVPEATDIRREVLQWQLRERVPRDD